ncbi:MAG: hypothetical protein JSS86_03020 [Cyanobacteria bacterium SZAS LIN-2]|nr:hypothetical protein [Cyanobacteria bacterium SZAS LIN-2]
MLARANISALLLAGSLISAAALLIWSNVVAAAARREAEARGTSAWTTRISTNCCFGGNYPAYDANGAGPYYRATPPLDPSIDDGQLVELKKFESDGK